MTDHPKWRLFNTGAGSGEWNMAFDAHLLGTSDIPTVRVYTWSLPTISLGFHQDPSAWLDLDKCRRLGVAVVRRPTGGRAVYHYHELTYSLTAPEDHRLVGGSLSTSWEKVSLGLIEALAWLGVRADLAAETGGRGGGKSPVCFSSSRRHEIAAGGKKLVGSAQRRQGGRFLQQGSVRLLFDQGALRDFMLDRPDEPDGDREPQPTPLGERLNGSVDLDKFARALGHGFGRLFGVDLVHSSPEPDDLARIDLLVPSHRIA